jgi:SAM-dependent methyltransferase
MYSVLKRFAKALIPKRLLHTYELPLRYLFAFQYRGKNNACTICDHTFKKFIPLNEKDILCPYCGSRARTRRLYQLLEERSLLTGKILHFSPSRSLYRKLNTKKNIEYFSTDYEDEFIAKFHYDITNIDCDDNTFDLIICYHILEHIVEDEQAMRELYRVLKPNGVCYIQTPFQKNEGIYEDYSIVSKEDRLKFFGQEDHVRVYSSQGLANRLAKNSFEKISVQEFEENAYFGLKYETIITVSK